MESQPARFIATGLLNSAATLSVIYGAMAMLGMSDIVANIIGYAIGLAISYGLNSRWTFRHTGPELPAVARFLASTVVAYCVNLAVVISSTSILEANRYVAQALGVPAYTMTFFLLAKRFAFKQT